MGIQQAPLNLHPATWAIAGIVLILSGLVLGPSFDIGVWLGILVLGWGVWRLVSWYVPQKPENRYEHHVAHHATHTKPRHAIHYLRCGNCRSIVRSTDYYCWKCGKRLR